MSFVDNKKFLEYLKNNSSCNLNFIKRISFNKKSISVKMIDKNDYNFIFNSFFTEKSLYNIIINSLINYDKDLNLNKDFLEYKYPKMNII